MDAPHAPDLVNYLFQTVSIPTNTETCAFSSNQPGLQILRSILGDDATLVDDQDAVADLLRFIKYVRLQQHRPVFSHFAN